MPKVFESFLAEFSVACGVLDRAMTEPIQAKANPSAFLGLLGKVLPLQMAGDKDDPLKHVHEVRYFIVRQEDGNDRT